jgi:amidase
MTRTVADAAALLAAIAGPDPEDPATAAGPSSEVAEALRTLVLDAGALTGVRLAVVRGDGVEPEGERPDAHRIAVHEAALAALCTAGATLVDATLPDAESDDEMRVLHHEFAPGMARYLARTPGAAIRSLADIQAWNREHEGEALKYGQVHVDRAVAIDTDAERDAYLAARSRDLAAATAALTEGLAGCEALVFPGAQGCGLAARAGWPSIVIPAGYAAGNRRPVGIMLVGPAWADARLLALAYALEQALPPRQPPRVINPALFRRFAH